MMEILNSSQKYMKHRIKDIKSRIAKLESLLYGENGKINSKIKEEISNAQFELKQLLARELV
jgi:hypothetical protein